jgi:NAD(P)-dependent dehydrogenase (short-subunit alcohol dehydrogenase family)
VGIEVPEGDAFELGWTVQAPAAMTDAVRWPEPDEIAQTALYLVDDAVGPMTGAVLAHDGGITAF